MNHMHTAKGRFVYILYVFAVQTRSNWVVRIIAKRKFGSHIVYHHHQLVVVANYLPTKNTNTAMLIVSTSSIYMLSQKYAIYYIQTRHRGRHSRWAKKISCTQTPRSLTSNPDNRLKIIVLQTTTKYKQKKRADASQKSDRELCVRKIARALPLALRCVAFDRSVVIRQGSFGDWSGVSWIVLDSKWRNNKCHSATARWSQVNWRKSYGRVFGKSKNTLHY